MDSVIVGGGFDSVDYVALADADSLERLTALRHPARLRQCIACINTFPDYLPAAFDIFCCISAHARLVALPLV